MAQTDAAWDHPVSAPLAGKVPCVRTRPATTVVHYTVNARMGAAFVVKDFTGNIAHWSVAERMPSVTVMGSVKCKVLTTTTTKMAKMKCFTRKLFIKQCNNNITKKTFSTS